MDTVKRLLGKLPSAINIRGPGGQTPLMASVLAGSTDVVSFLLTKGPDVTIGEKDGYTPMHGVGFQGRYALVPLLVAHGLDPNDVHTDGYSPLHRAAWGREERHSHTIKALIEVNPLIVYLHLKTKFLFLSCFIGWCNMQHESNERQNRP